jgi:chemotaxis protein methyltransferase CheR
MSDATTTDGFEKVLGYIDRNMAFEPGSYNDSYLDRRITARMRRTDTETYREYLDILSTERTEREALLDALSINVTKFFRNPEVWKQLREVLQQLTADNRTVRCWSAACADGREPYSLAMLAHDDRDIDANRLDILATDIDAETLQSARKGVYTSTRTTDIRKQLEPLVGPEDHFDIDGDEFAVRDSIQRMVSFEQHDLISGDPKDGFDLVLCRNLLIYIDSSYKEPIFETITDAIRPDGYLTIGKSETLPRPFREKYQTYDRTNHIYRRE